MNSNDVKKTIREINRFSKILKEAYVFNEDDDMMGQEEMNPRRMPQGNYRRQNDEMEDEMPQDEEMMEEDSRTDDILDKIRVLSLDGIQKYAEDVDNELYQTFKKIWLMCDKCLSEKDEVK